MFNIGIFLLIIIAFLFEALWLKSTTLMLLVFALGILFIVSVVSVGMRCGKVRGSLQIPIEISEKDRENLVKATLYNHTAGMLPRVAVLFVVKDVIRGTRRRFWRKISSVPVGESEYVETLAQRVQSVSLSVLFSVFLASLFWLVAAWSLAEWLGVEKPEISQMVLLVLLLFCLGIAQELAEYLPDWWEHLS